MTQSARVTSLLRTTMPASEVDPEQFPSYANCIPSVGSGSVSVTLDLGHLLNLLDAIGVARKDAGLSAQFRLRFDLAPGKTACTNMIRVDPGEEDNAAFGVIMPVGGGKKP